MASAKIKSLVFLSATVYRVPKKLIYKEISPLKSVNVYGKTKSIIKDALNDIKKQIQNGK